MAQNPEVLKVIGNKYEVYPANINTPYDGKTAVCINVLYDEGLSMDVYILDLFDKENKYLGLYQLYGKIPANYKRTTNGVFSPLKVGNKYAYKPELATNLLVNSITVVYISPTLVKDGTTSVLCWEETKDTQGYSKSGYTIYPDAVMRDRFIDRLETI